MTRAYDIALSGVLTSVRRMELMINNLANVETPGYKQELTGTATFNEQLVAVQTSTGTDGLGRLVTASVAERPAIDFTPGAIQPTGRALDIALDGPGFLAVQRGDQEVYTRDGSLVRDADGTLRTASGATILGQAGPVRLPPGAVLIAADGSVRVDGAVVDRLRIVEFSDLTVLRKQGNNELAPAGGEPPTPAARTQVQAGALEASNVDLTGTMTAMLEVQRAYVANQRLLQQQDELMARAVNDIAQPTS